MGNMETSWAPKFPGRSMKGFRGRGGEVRWIVDTLQNNNNEVNKSRCGLLLYRSFSNLYQPKSPYLLGREPSGILCSVTSMRNPISRFILDRVSG